MKKIAHIILAFLTTLLFTSGFCLSGFCQKTDTSHRVFRLRNTNIFKLALSTISKSPSDSASNASVINTKSETPYIAYLGKGIRHIYVKEYGFERAFSDTSRVQENNTGSRILNSLHHNTREWVIRNNLFVTENSPLNAYKVADNERYLRSLPYIQDARILVSTIADDPDSVDLIVITKDLFSFSGEIDNLSGMGYKGSISDANVYGMGQRIAVTTSVDPNRSPAFGYQALYSKNNIGGSFLNFTVAYSTIHNDLNTGAEDEHLKFISLQRPLYSQYSHLAGALSYGDFSASNEYRIKPDSLFYAYHYTTFDSWIGYNLGIQKAGLLSARDRHFVSLRYFRNNFLESPYQIGNNYVFKYNNRQGVLGQFNFFKQDFYKTNFIYGFGTTEDVPYGYNLALTTGWYQQSNLSRLYAGVNAYWYVATPKNDFIQYFFRSGGFLNGGTIQDASLLLGSSLFSRLFVFNGLKVRQFLNLSYTRLYNRVGLDPLRIDNIFGIRYFSSDSVLGDQRMSLHTETSFFLKYKLLGFKFAPFTFADFSLITPEHEAFGESDLYYSLGGGFRTRNENLVFGTIELRLAYFPRKANQSESFKISTNINLQFKYNATYVQAPDIVQLNSDNNTIYTQ